MPSSPAVSDNPPSKAQPGSSWKVNEQHVLPKNRLGIVFFGLMCCTFLAALDQVSQSISFLPGLTQHTDNCGHRSTYHCCGIGWG